MRATAVKGLAVVVLASTLASWGPKPSAQPALPAGITDEQLFGTMLRASRWAIWPDGSVPIRVCWENPSFADAHYRAVTRTAIEDTWQRYSAIQFTGWGECSENSLGIRIQVADARAHVDALGKYLDGRPNGMSLNFQFENWAESCSTRRDYCVYALAAHEFGHALGFTHEQNRDDAPPECQAEAQGTDGDYKVTEYDPFSIMNYCNPTWLGDGKLSELDIRAVQTVYGAP